MVVDKEKALQDWAQENPFLTDRLMFDFLGGKSGNCSLSPIFQDAIVKKYIDGTAVRQYTFAWQVTFRISETTDDINTQNMLLLRKWQAWIDEQQSLRNYPAFGEKCVIEKLENLHNMPQMAQRSENGTAKYQFFARLTYREVL